jgi:hypothetical protein
MSEEIRGKAARELNKQGRLKSPYRYQPDTSKGYRKV